MTPRIPTIDPATAAPDIQELLGHAVQGTGGADNIYLTLANHPGLMRRFLPFTAKLVLLSKIAPRSRELVILRVGWLCHSDYEWGQHARIAREVGVTDEEIARVPVGPDHAGWTPELRSILQATDELVRDHTISDDTWHALTAHLDEKMLIELPLLVGNYIMVAGFLNAMGVEREVGVEALPTRQSA